MQRAGQSGKSQEAKLFHEGQSLAALDRPQGARLEGVRFPIESALQIFMNMVALWVHCST